MRRTSKTKKLLRLLRKFGRLNLIFLNLVVLINLSACKTTTDNFELWGQPICLNDKTKEVVSDANIDYFILHNKMLSKECNFNKGNDST